MPAGNAIYGSHDGLGLSVLGHESTVSAICGDEDGQHVKTWRLGLCLFRRLMTSCISELYLTNCRHICINVLFCSYCYTSIPYRQSSGYCGRDLLPFSKSPA